jgi:hypothetical protein
MKRALSPCRAAVAAARRTPAHRRRDQGRAGRGAGGLANGQLDARQLAAVFTSSGADNDNCDAICKVLASDDRHISPTRFHNSVHNAPAGYWGIASGAMTPATVLCAHDASFGAGLLEALTQVAVDGIGTLLVTYDMPYPEPLHAKRPLPAAFGIALALMPKPSAQSLARIELSLCDDAPTGWPIPNSKPCAAPSPRRAACRCCRPWRKAAPGGWSSITWHRCGSPSRSSHAARPRPRLAARPPAAPGQHVPARCRHGLGCPAHPLHGEQPPRAGQPPARP